MISAETWWIILSITTSSWKTIWCLLEEVFLLQLWMTRINNPKSVNLEPTRKSLLSSNLILINLRRRRVGQGRSNYQWLRTLSRRQPTSSLPLINSWNLIKNLQTKKTLINDPPVVFTSLLKRMTILTTESPTLRLIICTIHSSKHRPRPRVSHPRLHLILHPRQATSHQILTEHQHQTKSLITIIIKGRSEWELHSNITNSRRWRHTSASITIPTQRTWRDSPWKLVCQREFYRWVDILFSLFVVKFKAWILCRQMSHSSI